MSQSETKRRQLAASLVADDDLSDEKIAEKCGITRKTLDRWKHQEAFQSRVKAITEAYAKRALENGLARREKRLKHLSGLFDKLQTVFDERGADPFLANVPGGKSGLIVMQIRGIGKDAREVYEVDTPAIKEYRALLDQVAEETGQKITRTKGEMDVKLTGAFKDMSDRELEQYAATGEMPERFRQP